MNRDHIDPFIDYIGLCYPGIWEDIGTLSACLPSMVESGMPARLLVLETMQSDELHQLRHRSLKELFQFSDSFRLSGLNGGHREPVTDGTDEMNGRSAGSPATVALPCSSELCLDSVSA